MSASRPLPHRLASIVGVAVLLLALLASSSRVPAEASARSPLKGLNLISGTRTRVTKVVLPADVTMPLRRLGAAVEVTGGGRAAGFALVAKRPVDGARPFYSYFRAGFCGVEACLATEDESASFLFYEGDTRTDDDTIELPAGDYLLYVIADGARVTVKLRIPELTGRSRLRPAGRADFEVTEPTVAVHETKSSTVYSNGDSFDMSGSESFSFNALRIRAAAWGAGQIGHCVYDQQPPPSPVAFAPGCPEGTNVPVTDAFVTPVPLTRIYATGAGRTSPGIIGHGSWYAAAAAVEEADAVGFNLDFDELP